MSRLFYYVIGVLVLGFVVSTITVAVLSFLPWISAFVVIIMPIYGYWRIRKRKNWREEKKSIGKRWGGKIKKSFSLRRSWNFYLILGIAVGFAFEEIVELMVTTMIVIIISLLGMCFLWELIRWVVKKQKGIVIPSYIESCKSFWK